jgi:hypothetical protein
MIPEIAHPILLLGGGQGTGKTTAARMIAGIIDPSAAPTQSQPSDPEQYALTIAAAQVRVFDNVSKIPEWWSDALCKTVTGDSWVKRKLYTDGELSVASFRRVVVMTSIDAGSLRGDLADRLVLVELDKIEDSERRSESEILARFAEIRPRLFGALCTLLAQVLEALPGVKLDELPRMADFARVLAAVDAVRGTRSLATYLGQGERLADDVVEGDSVGTAIRGFMANRSGKSWSGTMKDLLAEITPDPPARDFPKTPKGLGSRLKRLAPALEAVGVFLYQPGKTDKTRTWMLQGDPKALTAQTPETRTDDPENAVDPRAIPF